MQIPISKPFFDETEFETIVNPLKKGWVAQGPYVKEFEKLFAEYTGAYAQTTSNGTTALHLGLLAMGIGPGDKVIVPAFTYVASANTIEHVHANVIFCDIELSTFNLNVIQLSKLLEEHKNIKAIMPVHLFGLCANMPAILKLAKEYNVLLIEDAACAFDAWIGNQHAGTFGDCGCFSFHPRKSITTGEGGMVISSDKKLIDMIAKSKNHGADKQTHELLLPDYPIAGYNYRMTDLQAALGVCQMLKAKKMMQARQEIAKKYSAQLNKIIQLRLPAAPATYHHSFQSYVCLFTGDNDVENLTLQEIDQLHQKRNDFMSRLLVKGIATRQGTHAVHTLAYYKKKYNYRPEDYKSAFIADRLSIALPLYSGMTELELNYVIENIHNILN